MEVSVVPYLFHSAADTYSFNVKEGFLLGTEIDLVGSYAINKDIKIYTE